MFVVIALTTISSVLLLVDGGEWLIMVMDGE